MRDLTIAVGSGNAGAIGLQFNASNQGTIRNVTIRAAGGSGTIGLDMGFTDEIGPLLVRNFVVEGFDLGISTKWPVNSVTFEHVTLRGQSKFGWWNYHQMIFVSGLESENAVPAIYDEKDSWGTVTLVDSRITGKGARPKTPGVLNQRLGVDLLACGSVMLTIGPGRWQMRCPCTCCRGRGRAIRSAEAQAADPLQ